MNNRVLLETNPRLCSSLKYQSWLLTLFSIQKVNEAYERLLKSA
jgi:hypothetical protein